MKNKINLLPLLVLYLIFFSVSAAQVKEEPKVNEILKGQLKALKDNSYENFIKRGNKAFKELTPNLILKLFTWIQKVSLTSMLLVI